MKAERRHELQTNSLVLAIYRFQDTLRKHAAKIILGVVVVALIIVLIYQRISQRRADALESQNSVARAWDNLLQLESAARRPEPAEEAFKQREMLVGFVRDQIDFAQKHSTDPQVLAGALVAQGQLNWELANMPPLPAATTRPELQLDKGRSHSEYLTSAEAAYRAILEKYPNEKVAAVQAHLGLGAIAENRSNWADAKAQYQAVKDLPGAPETFKLLADSKLTALAKIQQPVYLPPATAPSTQTTQPTTQTTQPTTTPRPSAEAPPATRPATAPAP